MRYAILIYTDPAADRSEMEEWFEYSEQLARSGKLVGGEALEGTDTAATVRIRDGETLVTDGPFAETKEVLGGFYLIEADGFEEAKEWAARIPSTPYGSTEVRPIREFDRS